MLYILVCLHGLSPAYLYVDLRSIKEGPAVVDYMTVGPMPLKSK